MDEEFRFYWAFLLSDEKGNEIIKTYSNLYFSDRIDIIKYP
jgi:hypothetical protein